MKWNCKIQIMLDIANYTEFIQAYTHSFNKGQTSNMQNKFIQKQFLQREPLTRRHNPTPQKLGIQKKLK